MKLTRELREKILKKLLDHRFKNEQDALNKETQAMSAKIYASKYTPELLGLMAQLPKNSFKKLGSFKVRVGDRWEYFRLDTSVEILYSDSQACFDLVPDSAVGKELYNLVGRKNKLHARRSEAYNQVWEVLNSVTTINRLIKVWPETEPFVKEYLFDSPTLPAVPVQQLNELLELSSESN